jgi:hypothetical protein
MVPTAVPVVANLKSLASTPVTGSLKVTVKVALVAVDGVPATGAVEETEGAFKVLNVDTEL